MLVLSSGVRTIINQAQITYAADPQTSDSTETNTIVTVIADEMLCVRKKSERKSVGLCEEYRYWLCIANQCAETLKQVVVTDELDPAAEFIRSSICVDGQELTRADIGRGVAIGDLAPGEFVVISYGACVRQKPACGYVDNTATATYRLAGGACGSTSSNTVRVQVEACELMLISLPDRTTICCGDILTYTGSVTNTGNFPAENISLQFTIPFGTELRRNSLLINGGRLYCQWSCEQIPLGNLCPGQSANFAFQLQVVTRQSCQAKDRTAAIYRCANGCSCNGNMLMTESVINELALNPCVDIPVQDLYRVEE